MSPNPSRPYRSALPCALLALALAGLAYGALLQGVFFKTDGPYLTLNLAEGRCAHPYNAGYMPLLFGFASLLAPLGLSAFEVSGWFSVAGTALGVGIALLAFARVPQDPAAVAAAPAPWWGYALLLGAVVCEASYVVIGKRLTGQVSPRRISALINLWGLVLVTPLGLWQALRFDFAAVGVSTWVLLVFYALAASMVTVWLWMRGLRHVPAPRAGVFTVMLPVSAALVGVLFLGESFGSAHLAALGLAVGGLLLATWPSRGRA